MPSYGSAGRWGALGSGLRGIGEMLVRNRQEDEEQRRRQEMLDLQMATQRAEDQLRPGAVGLGAVADASQQMPTDAVQLPTGVFVSPSQAQETAVAQEEEAWQRRLGRELEAAKLAEQERAYGPEGRTERGLGSFWMERYPEELQVPGMTARGATQAGPALEAGRQTGRQSRETVDQPNPNWAQAQQSVLEVAGVFEVDPESGRRYYQGPKPGLTAQDIMDWTRRAAAGGPLPTPAEIKGDEVPVGGTEPLAPPWREKRAPELSIQRPIGAGQEAAPQAGPTARTPASATDMTKLPNESVEDYVLRMKEQLQGQGLDINMIKTRLAKLLREQGLVLDAPGT